MKGTSVRLFSASLGVLIVALGLGCGGLMAPSTDQAAPTEGFILEMTESAERCSWKVLGGQGPVDFTTHDGSCPPLNSFGESEGPIPSVVVVGENLLRVGADGTTQVLSPPPDGSLIRGAIQNGDLVAATLITIEGAGPYEYAGKMWKWEYMDGLMALAIRWRHDGKTWKREEIATTTTGWDYGMGIDALKKPVRAFDQIGDEFRGTAVELADPKLNRALEDLAGQPSGEGWLLANTAHGRIALGLFISEFIHSTGPVLIEKNGTWKQIPLEGASNTALRTRLTSTHLLVQVPWAEGVVIDLKSGDVVQRSTGTMYLIK